MLEVGKLSTAVLGMIFVIGISKMTIPLSQRME